MWILKWTSIKKEEKKGVDVKMNEHKEQREKELLENEYYDIEKSEVKKTYNEEKSSELEKQEKDLLEKKSEVLRRYLSENVMPLLAKGILTVCESMPDDPVDALANFLLENSFNMQKAKIGEIEKIMDNE